MKKSIYDLAYETVHEDGTPLTENQENEIDALVQFGKRVLENCRPTKRARDGAECVCENHTDNDGWRCNVCDVIAELRNELAEYVALHSKVADELGTANHKLMQIEDLAKRESGLTPRAADECPTCAGLGFVNDKRGRRGVDCSDCNGSGIRR